MKRIFWITFFLLVLLIHLVAIYLENQTLMYLSKPVLMPVLIAYLLTDTKGSGWNLKTWVVLALFFSWLGDIFLMMEHDRPVFFLVGLSSFLLAQIFYIIFFHNIRMREYIRGNALLLLLVILYYSILISVLSPYLGNLTLPVRIYGVVLSFMLMLAMHTMLGKNKHAGLLMMLGAIFFVVSDSLLAFNKFLAAFNYSGEIIMLTYGVAQLLIVQGAVRYINAMKTV